MRVVVLGGTMFIGRAVAAALAARDDELMLVHRGQTEPEGLPEARHVHVARADLATAAGEIAAFAPDAAVDVFGMDGADADAALAALPDGIRLVAISSGDVYRAFESLHAGTQTDAVPLTESAPLRAQSGNRELEERYLTRGAAVLRLGAVYGEHDYQRRFEFVLRRLRAGRREIPAGTGTFLFSRVYVGDVAEAVLRGLDEPRAAGEAFNVVAEPTEPFLVHARRIVAIAGAEAALVRVPQHLLPADLAITGEGSQHILMDATKARSVLGWAGTDAIERSVRWHLEHPPAEWSEDFAADDAALAHSSRG